MSVRHNLWRVQRATCKPNPGTTVLAAGSRDLSSRHRGKTIKRSTRLLPQAHLFCAVYLLAAARGGRVRSRRSRSHTGARGGAFDSASASWAMPGGGDGSAQPRLLVADRDRPAGAVRPGRPVPGAGMPHRLRPVAAPARTACQRAPQAMRGAAKASLLPRPRTRRT